MELYYKPGFISFSCFQCTYFSASHFLRAQKRQGSSFIKEELFKGFCWVLGDGSKVVAVRDPWLRNKMIFV